MSPMAQSSTIPEIPGACMYLVRGEAGPLERCNAPAVCQTLRGFRYCKTHRNLAAEACQRKKIPFIIRPLHTSQSSQKVP